ncbi:hypothetical protein GGR57DRAFT_480495 [Xylariaceae sp. FL1272]|nr:hypothetical protein GGR57DRAFT_480495 [Xylariaceae sp. FL1272]
MAPVNCEVGFDASVLAGKTAVVTGGAGGLGQAYVRALVEAKAYVVFGDNNPQQGKELESSLPGTKFVQCDVTNWEDQVRLFKEAASSSPSGKVHYVVANAGITHADDVFTFEGHDAEPKKPSLDIVDVNLYGTLYTCKLAFYYFVKQNGTEASRSQEDTCLILIGSGAAFLDCPRAPQYAATKYGVRGIMRSLRRTTSHYGSRINVISPWYVRTQILTKDQFDNVESAGVTFAEALDAGQALLRLLSDKELNGKTIFVSPRKWAPRGYMDPDVDDFPEGSLLAEIQAEQVVSAPGEVGLFV